jgi:3-hydroxyisobutyrate dehydrogenase-like beta-hydroxyacid dehydrogenase
MGESMSTRLVDAGLDLKVWNRTAERAQALVDEGAVLVDTPLDLAGCDVVFSMLAHGAALHTVMNGDGGLLTGESGPDILIDCSTVSVEDSATLRESAEAVGTRFLAAPVSGNPRVVAAGGLNFVVSGPEEAYETARFVMSHIGDSTYVGEGEVSRNVKIAHNLYLAVVTQSLAEVTVLCQKLGVPRSAFLEFLNKSAMGSTFSGYKTPAFVNLDFHPTFTTELLKKDLELGLAASREVGVTLPTVALTHQLVQGLIGKGHGQSDFAALIEQQAAMAGMTLEPENVEVDDGFGSH